MPSLLCGHSMPAQRNATPSRPGSTMPAPCYRFALPFALASSLVAGCGPSEPKRYSVTGLVKYKGTPIPAGTITFTPEDQSLKSAGGAAIKDGKFEIARAVGLL